MVCFNIVGRTQIGKLLNSPIKQAYIEQIVAYHMGELSRGFESGELNEDLIEDVDESHFIINMDNGKLWDLDEMILSSMQMWYLLELESQWWYDYQGTKTVGYMILS